MGTETYRRFLYKNAPLQEAIFQAIFVADVDDVTLPGLFFEKIAQKFPNKRNIELTGVQLSNREALKKVPVMQAWDGTHQKCLQFGSNVVAANDLAYTEWEGFIPMIDLLLKSYFECITPLAVEKIGFRCINRFVIPHDNVKISEYFCINLAVPSSLQDGAGFNINLLKQETFNDTKIDAHIRFSSDGLRSPDESGFAFILDIEMLTYNGLTNNPKDILKKASDCHEFLKRIFEDLLQPKMRSLLEER